MLPPKKKPKTRCVANRDSAAFHSAATRFRIRLGARIDRYREAYRRRLRPYLARCLTAIAKRTGGLPRAVSVRPFYFWLRSARGGLDRFARSSQRITLTT